LEAETYCGDIRTIRRSHVAEKLSIKSGFCGIIIGGPPCQGFSSIRPFRSSGEDDPRNSLFEEFASFVNYFRPTVFVMENVVGLATHNSGLVIEQIQNCFFQLGYDTEWKILNTAHYGVPQKRERLILIGVEKGGVIPFPNPTHTFDGPTIGYRNHQKMLVRNFSIICLKEVL
jgi:DNA (cytosine-5)-methyltransferase 1